MTTIQDLTTVLKKLRLSGILQTMELREQQATDDNLTYRDFLFALLNDEVERREAKQLHLRLRRASFDSQRTIEDFDFAFNPRIPKAKIIDLATCHFVERKENVLLVGPTGVGKSHLAQALGNRACRVGHSVLYLSAHELLTKLRAARADGSYDRCLARFSNPDLLIVDDLGLRPLELAAGAGVDGEPPTDESAIKLHFLALRRFDKIWSRTLWNWSSVLGQFAIYFKGRIPTLVTSNLRSPADGGYTVNLTLPVGLLGRDVVRAEDRGGGRVSARN